MLPLPPGASHPSVLEVFRPELREWEEEAGKADEERRDYVDQDGEEESEDVIRRRGVWGGRVLVVVICKASVVLFESKEGKSDHLGFMKVNSSLPSRFSFDLPR